MNKITPGFRLAKVIQTDTSLILHTVSVTLFAACMKPLFFSFLKKKACVCVCVVCHVLLHYKIQMLQNDVFKVTSCLFFDHLGSDS